MSLRCSPRARHIYPSLVLVQPRKTCPSLNERLLMGRKESNQIKQNLSVYMSALGCRAIENFDVFRVR